jgi:3-oxoadipate enol-lactonase/4-carboxymuconolactone decarboxylase
MTVPTIRCTIDAADESSVSTELLVLGPSLGTTISLWNPAVAALTASGGRRATRILRFDLPGHGVSPVATEPFTMAELADAVLRLVDEAGGGRFHYAGVSLGGAIGIELALRHPERVLSLAIFNSDARIGSPQTWTDRAAQVTAQGTSSLIGATPARWFAADFIAREPAVASGILSDLSETDDASYAFCCGALGGFDRSADVGAIALPTIAVSGSGDPVTTPDAVEHLARAIPGARYVEIPNASHLAAVEKPAEAAAILADLLASAGDLYSRGMRTRRAVLGDAHVDAAQAKITAETASFQEFITRYAWGDVWSRPELSCRERSIATLASLVTGSHEHEIAMHERAALTNGLSRIEIAEVMLHTALYAGLPPANRALAIARDVFAELDKNETHG